MPLLNRGAQLTLLFAAIPSNALIKESEVRIQFFPIYQLPNVSFGLPLSDLHDFPDYSVQFFTDR